MCMSPFQKTLTDVHVRTGLKNNCGPQNNRETDYVDLGTDAYVEPSFSTFGPKDLTECM